MIAGLILFGIGKIYEPCVRKSFMNNLTKQRQQENPEEDGLDLVPEIKLFKQK